LLVISDVRGIEAKRSRLAKPHSAKSIHKSGQSPQETDRVQEPEGFPVLTNTENATVTQTSCVGIVPHGAHMWSWETPKELRQMHEI